MSKSIRKLVWAGFVLVCMNGRSWADFTFYLEPGSTITPLGGLPEALTGTLVMRDIGSGGGLEMYETIALDFRSDSFRLTIDHSPANDVVTGLFPDGSSYFLEVVNDDGFPEIPLKISGIEKGSYTGTMLDPKTLSYTDLYMFPMKGIGPYARISFTATTVPEPTSLVLFALGSGMLVIAFRGRSSLKNSNPNRG